MLFCSDFRSSQAIQKHATKVKTVGTLIDVRRVFALRKRFHTDDLDMDVLIVDQLLFGCYSTFIAQVWPTFAEKERNAIISHIAKILK